MMKHFVILSIFVASCFAVRGEDTMAAIREEPKSDYRVNGALGAGPTKNLILTEQELRFAGQTLRSVLSGNMNGYVS